MGIQNIYKIAVPSPLRRLFDYLGPEGNIVLPRGLRVEVPFGRRTVTGWIVSRASDSELPVEKLKSIQRVLDERPLLPDHLFELFLWAADYYQHPIGDVLANCLPTHLRRGLSPRGNTERCWRITTHGKGLSNEALKRAPKQRQALALLLEREVVSLVDLESQGLSTNILHQLEKKGLAESFARPSTDTEETVDWSEDELLAEPHLPLYPQQARAVDSINLHGFQISLLQGETGSGKTEVYLQVIEKVLRYGRQALVLVPEIGLTPQTIQRFRNRFHCPVALLHSGLTDLERLKAWQSARDGTARILVGTRSAVFAPLKKPGIIIVDEEHDTSFKQQEGFRYSARDLAVMRAQRESIPLILGSATPSLESLHNARRNRYQHLLLNRRPGTAVAPAWQLVNIRHQRLDGGISPQLASAIGDQLNRRNQVLVFLNRRGFAPTLMCHDCGWIAECPRCETRLTAHLGISSLLCHHCEYRKRIAVRCPSCCSSVLQFLGRGTEQGEEIFRRMFPGFPVFRIDADTTRRKHAMREFIERVHLGEPCILLGTQMLAKGHHFPDVTLVAILDIDGGLFSPDFRAAERMGQLITQVAGRAGREDKPGQVILQSHYCDHPLIENLSRYCYGDFAGQLLHERRMCDLPPFRPMALLRAEAMDPVDAERFLHHARQRLERQAPDNPDITLLGPLPAPMEKRGGRYRFQLTLTCRNRGRLQALLTPLGRELEIQPLARQVRWSIDVDPQDMT